MALMQGVFAIFSAWNLSVLWGNLLGGAAAVINFLLMGITVQNVMGYEEKRLRNAVRLSQMLRMLLLIAVAALGVALPCFSTVAALVPLFFPAELLSFLLFGVLGVAVTAAALACFAQLMAGQGCSGSVVPILATTAVCMGSLLCALTAAFRKKARGLLTGLLQSTFLAVPLALSAIWNGTAAEPAVVCRLLAVLLCGCIGGLLGVTLRSRRHTLR